jgi:hypothetical protein
LTGTAGLSRPRGRARREGQWILLALDEDEIRYLFGKLPALERDPGWDARTVCMMIRDAIEVMNERY